MKTAFHGRMPGYESHRRSIARLRCVLFALLAIAVFPASSVTSAVLSEPDGRVPLVAHERLGTKLPLDTVFQNEAGQSIVLGDLIDGKPVVLSFVYYECPALCNVTLNNLLDGFKRMSPGIGEDFNVIAIGFDHEETSEVASKKKDGYLQFYGREGAEEGWHFLVGEKESIQHVADAARFTFAYDSASDEFAHESLVLILTPDGVISRFFSGLKNQPMSLRLGILEASGGEVGTVLDKLSLMLYRFNPVAGTYDLNATRLAIVLIVLAALLVGVVGVRMLLRDRQATSAPAQPWVDKTKHNVEAA